MKKKQNIKLQHTQKGVSLVSLMIGMIISLLTIGALFVLFQQSTVQSTQMREDMNLEGQVATILLSFQQDIQSAGFGLDTSVVTAIHSESDASAGAAILDKVYWRYQYDSTTYHCRGFEESWDATNGRLIMHWLNEQPCHGGALDTVIWPAANRELAGIFEGDEMDAEFLTVSLSSGRVSCSQYSQQGNGNHRMITLIAKNSILDATTNKRKSHSYNYCLTNL